MTAGGRRSGDVLAARGARQPRAQSRREPDGTGLGWFGEDGRAAASPSSRSPPTRTGSSRARRASSSRRTFVAHIRYATTGAIERAQHAPVRAARPAVRPQRRDRGPRRGSSTSSATTCALVRGDTDSERLFALITARDRAPRRRRGGGHHRGRPLGRRATSRFRDQPRSWPPRTGCGRSATPTRTSCGCSSAPPAARAAIVTSTPPAPPARCASAPAHLTRHPP